MAAFLEIFLILGGVFLFYSLIVTQITEIVSGVLAIRAKYLAKGIKHLLGTNLGEQLISHPLIQSITFTHIKIPSYIPDYLFAKALINILYKKQTLNSEQKNNLNHEIISDIPPQVQMMIANHTTPSEQEVELKLARWFSDAMDRLSGAYKRYIQKITIVIAFILVVLTNADSLQIIQKIWSDPMVKKSAFNLVQEQLAHCEIKEQKIICSEIQTALIPSLISFWSIKEINQMSWKDWLFKFFGFIFTTLGIALGAPFWFDILTRIAPGLRMGGPQVKASSS